MAQFLYIHIPFCVRKCSYCDFLSIPYDEAFAGDYVRALSKELEMRKGEADELSTVYLGGGTPSLLTGKALRTVFTVLRKHYRIYRNAEITAEVNPGAADSRKLDVLRALGVNRLSIGIQSFNDHELETLGRIHTGDEAREAHELAHSAAFTNISLDLMYGIPGQTVSSWQETLKKAVSLRPAHISAYELTPEKCTPLASALGEGRLSLPPEDEVIRMSDEVIDLLGAQGYERYEISNYCRPGFRSLHNVNYWERGEYLGIGAGAHSFIKGRRFHNTADIRQYVTLLDAGKSAAAESVEVTPGEAAKEFLFLGLRKTDGVDFKKAEELLPEIVPASGDLVAEGLLIHESGRLKLTRSGMRLMNSVLVRLFGALGL